MGKSFDNAIADHEYTMLQAHLYQCVHNSLTYLDVLNQRLGEYDYKHHLHHSISTTSLFCDSLDHAKDAVQELKRAADYIHKSTGAAEANRTMKQASNALADLHQVAKAYDTRHSMSSKHNGIKATTSETVEWLVSTTRDAHFTGFARLQRQIIRVQTAIGEIEKPSIKTRAKEAVHNVTYKLDKIRAEHKSSP
ncbi:unnamed protein product [Peronospora farinosa]|uniref:Fungal N-terminal domain-containing protein n=1 Tax=Peronospora farinosa TaxID=134698 RepID=A0AAV0ULT7_9STRA|nr:unnamed protein product [Peronospora farinosa]CAI5737293.1 unnamed protein product [Peronospora farinosa]